MSEKSIIFDGENSSTNKLLNSSEVPFILSRQNKVQKIQSLTEILTPDRFEKTREAKKGAVDLHNEPI